MIDAIDTLRPKLKEPFPDIQRYWVCPKTGLRVPKHVRENIEWRKKLLRRAENDPVLQRDLMSACRESRLFWINAFCWTYHQFDEDPITGKKIVSKYPHQPFITWAIQDDLFNLLEWCLANAEDLLIDKSRKMGASWACANFLHGEWLFEPDSQLLEMSRTREYVDQTGNMKALFQKHDYINEWLPLWMRPEGCLPDQPNRTKMHLSNMHNGSCIDGESTTPHAARGDRRKIALLDEFAMVEYGDAMLSATGSACLMRIINSTPSGPGTAYSREKNSGRMKVFVMPFYEHPDMGAGRYVKETEFGKFEIRSPWFDQFEKTHSPKEVATEVLRQDIESGEVFFTSHNIDKHIAMYVREPLSRWNVKFKKEIADSAIGSLVRSKSYESLLVTKCSTGKLRVWTNLMLGRPDQSKSYIFGIDLSKGQGASNSVVSIKCKETGEKIAEWKDATVPPYEMASIVMALAIWCGGRKPHGLPFLKWENNGPGWDFGKKVVKNYKYPYYYRSITPGMIADKKKDSYGWQNNRQSKYELLAFYDRVLATGGYINHSKEGLEEAKIYVHFSGGGIGPAYMVEESDTARKTHGDIVMADALTLEDSDIPRCTSYIDESEMPTRSPGYRIQQMALKLKKKKRGKLWRKKYDFTRGRY